MDRHPAGWQAHFGHKLHLGVEEQAGDAVEMWLQIMADNLRRAERMAASGG